MNCKNCGNFCPDGHNFCLHCGAPLVQTAAPSEPTADGLKFSGTASDEPTRSAVKISGGVPLSQSNGSFRPRRNSAQESTDPETATPDPTYAPTPAPDLPHTPTPAPDPTYVPTPAPELPPRMPRKKWGVGLMILLVVLFLSVCGMIVALLFHFGVIGGKSPDEPLTESPDGSLSSEEVHDLYEAYFCEHYLATDRVCLADVTHDGVDEMIVIQFSDELGTYIYGYVYSIDEKGAVRQIYSITGSNFHLGGYFEWYLKETSDGFVLAQEDGYWSTGLGELFFYEYSLGQDGTMNIIDSAQITAEDYDSLEEASELFDVYSARIAEMKSDFYTLYFAPGSGTDSETLGAYPMNAADIFDLSSISTTPALKDGEVLLSVDPAPLMAYAEKMMSTEDLDACYLYDIDGDGLCEMILRHGQGEAGRVFDFYTYQNGLLYLGQLSGGHSSICIANGQLSRHYGQMGYEDLYTVTLKNGAVSEELIHSSQLAEGEEYASYPEPTAKTDQKDLNIFSYVYAEKWNRVAAVSDHCEEKDGYFSDGRYAYQLLPDGSLWYVDAATGVITICGTKIPENTTLFGVTENSFYFEYSDPNADHWWGFEIYGLNKTTLVRTNYGSGWVGSSIDGYIIFKKYRSDVSPTLLTVIDKEDTLRLDSVPVWDVAVLDHCVYYFSIDSDAYFEMDSYIMTEYRLDANGSTKIADFWMDGGFSYVYSEEKFFICNETDPERYYDIRTGEPVD